MKTEFVDCVVDSLIDPDKQVVHLKCLKEGDLKYHLQVIVDALKSFHGAENDFFMIFPKFQENRKSCIEKQNELASSLDKLQLKCNVSTTISSCVAICGSVATILGTAALVIGTGGVATPAVVAIAPAVIAAAPAVAAVGGVSAITGGATVLGTKITQTVIEVKHVDQVKLLLKDDQLYAEKILKWIKRTDEVTQAIESIMDYSIFEQLLKMFKKDTAKYKDCKNKIKLAQTLKDLTILIENLPISQKETKLLKQLMSVILGNEECYNLFTIIAALFTEVAPDIEKIERAIRIAVNSFRCLDGTLHVGNAAVTMVRSIQPVTKFIVAAGFLSAVSLAIDIYTLIQTSMDIAKGSQSELAGKIRNCAQKLQEELDSLEMIYEQLRLEN